MSSFENYLSVLGCGIVLEGFYFLRLYLMWNFFLIVIK